MVGNINSPFDRGVIPPVVFEVDQCELEEYEERVAILIANGMERRLAKITAWCLFEEERIERERY